MGHDMAGADGDIVACFDELAHGKAHGIVLDDLFDEGLSYGLERGVCSGCEVSADEFEERRGGERGRIIMVSSGGGVIYALLQVGKTSNTK
jgi:hypothetical protein